MGHPINPVPPIIVLTIVGDTEDTPVAVRCALFESQRNGPNLFVSIGGFYFVTVRLAPVSGFSELWSTLDR